jgi:UDP-2,4-diacetamido-2,4,6-trideoxy-beta-L-altropyranose hydrolase
MKVVFRVDASLAIGTGHVMRCLTLAQALAAEGSECHFICREHPGHMIEAIRSRGFSTHVLSAKASIEMEAEDVPQPAHAVWLGASWQEDARQSQEQIEHLAPDWLVVDHYALDKRWEQAVVPSGCWLLVIDDLADREHACDLLLDQNLGRQGDDYAGLVPQSCNCLIGPEYALLRPEFARMREASLARRAEPQLKHLLVTMGGVDKDNATGEVLSALRDCRLPDDCRITVVMGANAPWLEQVKDQAANMPWPTEVVVNVGNMAERMCNADLAIGAAGSTSWERCCLGLPTLLLIMAKNQQFIAYALDAAGAAITLGTLSALGRLPAEWQELCAPERLARISTAAATHVDGEGATLVTQYMIMAPDEN